MCGVCGVCIYVLCVCVCVCVCVFGVCMCVFVCMVCVRVCDGYSAVVKTIKRIRNEDET